MRGKFLVDRDVGQIAASGDNKQNQWPELKKKNQRESKHCNLVLVIEY